MLCICIVVDTKIAGNFNFLVGVKFKFELLVSMRALLPVGQASKTALNSSLSGSLYSVSKQ